MMIITMMMVMKNDDNDDIITLITMMMTIKLLDNQTLPVFSPKFDIFHLYDYLSAVVSTIVSQQ